MNLQTAPSSPALRAVAGEGGLSATGLGKRYRKRPVVRNVSLSLRRGEAVGLLGPNGAGKTTLVNLLSGEIRPTAGRVELMGRDVTGEPAWRLTRLGIGRSFQRINIFAPLTVLENVRLSAQAVTVPVYGKLADVHGRKPVLLFGIAVFVAASLFCGLAWSMPALIVGRALLYPPDADVAAAVDVAAELVHGSGR